MELDQMGDDDLWADLLELAKPEEEVKLKTKRSREQSRASSQRLRERQRHARAALTANVRALEEENALLQARAAALETQEDALRRCPCVSESLLEAENQTLRKQVEELRAVREAIHKSLADVDVILGEEGDHVNHNKNSLSIHELTSIHTALSQTFGLSHASQEWSSRGSLGLDRGGMRIHAHVIQGVRLNICLYLSGMQLSPHVLHHGLHVLSFDQASVAGPLGPLACADSHRWILETKNEEPQFVGDHVGFMRSVIKRKGVATPGVCVGGEGAVADLSGSTTMVTGMAHSLASYRRDGSVDLLAGSICIEQAEGQLGVVFVASIPIAFSGDGDAWLDLHAGSVLDNAWSFLHNLRYFDNTKIPRQLYTCTFEEDSHHPKRSFAIDL